MKHLLFILILLLSVFSYSQHKTINLSSENLKGKVQSYTQKTYLIVDNATDLVQKYHVKYSFNKKGDLKSIVNYRADNKLDSQEMYEYDQGKLLKITFYNTLGTATKTTLFGYDENGNLASQKKYNSPNKLQYETSYIFNQKGQLTMEQKLIPSINYTMKENYSYDDFDNLIVRTKSARIGSTKETFRYNSKALPIKKSEYNAMGELFSVIEYEYNEQNDKISLKKYNADKTLTYYEDYHYKYDVKENWIERVSFEKGEKVNIEKREIQYY